MFKKLALITALALAMSGSLHSAETISKSSRIDDFRPLGDERIWSIFMNDSAIGRLGSRIAARTVVDGIEGFLMHEELIIDYALGGNRFTMNVISEHRIGVNGAYLGDKMRLNINGQKESLELQRLGDSIVGFMTRSGNQVPSSFAYPIDGFAIDQNFYDQLEIFLAMIDLRVGDTIRANLLAPQTLMTAPFLAVVGAKMFLQLPTSDTGDSVIVVNVIEPQAQTIYLSFDKRLVLAELPNRMIRVILESSDWITPQDTLADSAPVGRTISPTRQKIASAPTASLIGYFLAYFAIGSLLILFLGAKGMRWGISYVSALVGAGAFLLAIISQIPLQEYMVREIFLPQLQGGGSPFVWGLFPATAAGIVQEILLAAGIYAVVLRGEPARRQIPTLGVFCAGAFGIAESIYITASIPGVVMSMPIVVERVFTMMFLVASGAILGWAIARDWEKTVWAVIILALVNGIYRYLPVFVQFQVLSVEVVSIIGALLSMATVSFVLIWMKRFDDFSESTP